MSFKVIVIPEDPTYNGYILKPLVEKLMAEVGKPNAKVIVVTNPKISGYEHAKRELKKIVNRYQDFDLFLFLPDRDGKTARDLTLKNLTEKFKNDSINLIALAAVEEIETWLLAGHKNKLEKSWLDVRTDKNVKESIFIPFLSEHGDEGAGEGRERLMKETLRNFNALIQSCPEIGRLINEIEQLLGRT